jgi:hypothetical protein
MLIPAAGPRPHLGFAAALQESRAIMLVFGIIVVVLVAFGFFWQRGRSTR